MEEFQKQHKRLWQLVEYLFSGGVYFWVGYAVVNWLYYGLNWRHGAKFWWATLIGNLAGWTVNFLLQRYWVFKNPELAKHQTKVTSRYIVITLVDFVLNYLILTGLKDVGVTPAIGQFISSAFFTPWNYVWYRFWVFPERGDHLRVRASLHRLFLHRAHGHSAYRG